MRCATVISQIMDGGWRELVKGGVEIIEIQIWLKSKGIVQGCCTPLMATRAMGHDPAHEFITVLMINKRDPYWHRKDYLRQLSNSICKRPIGD